MVNGVGVAALLGAIGAGSVATILAASERLRPARVVVSVAVLGSVVSTAALISAIARLDFSLVYVAAQSRARSPGAYRFAALWGGPEGSLLLFSSLLALAILWTVWRSPIDRWGIAAGAAAIALLSATVAAFANPFETAPLPAVRGAGLTPILEHPAMLYHPPILYVGLVLTAIAYIRIVDRPAVVADVDVGPIMRPALFAWTMLTVGLATGANWAYVEVGWGGYWAWDPVENTVLMPWLLLTASIHVLRSHDLRRRFPVAVAALCVSPFVFVAFGTAITRSGGLSSVHAFADSDALGVMLGLLVAASAAVAVLRITSARTRLISTPVNRPADWLLLTSAALACFMVVVVAMGVTVPLLPGSNRIVTAAYYNRIGAPLLVIVLAAMLLAPNRWKSTNVTRTLGSAAVGAVAVFIVALVAGARDILVFATLVLGATVVIRHVESGTRARLATLAGHLGFVVLAIGIAASAQATSVRTLLEPGDVARFGPDLMLRYESFTVVDGPRPGSEAVTTSTVITRASTGSAVAPLFPGIISYPDRGVVLAETALHSTPRRDVQVVVQTVAADGTATFEISYRPGLMLVWWGATLIAVSGLVALARRRVDSSLAVGASLAG